MGFPDGSARISLQRIGDMGLIPGLRRFPGGGHGNPLQYSCLKNPENRGTEEPSGSQRVRHNWACVNAVITKWKWKVESLSRVRLFATPSTVTYEVPPSGIFQARVLEWIAISFSRGSSRPRKRTRVSGMAGRRFTVWVTREVIAKEDVKSKNPQGLLTPNGNRPHSVILTTHSALKL